MLLQRVITALVLIPLVLLGIFYLPLTAFQIFLGAVMLGCAWEWTHLMHMESLLERFIFLLLTALLCFAVTWVAMGYFLYLVCIGIVACISLVHRYQTTQAQFKLKEVYWYPIGLIMFVACWYSLNILRFKVGGSGYVLMLLLIVWAADTAAYFSGKYFGKTKLASHVSPKKSWEGVKGAAIAVFVLTMIEAVFLKSSFPEFLAMVLLNAATFIVAVYGDLFESMIKRMADCKDSGGLLPGHGGLLDRLDSLFFAAPVYTTGMFLIAMHFR